MRMEHDLLGEMDIPESVYWGIHTQRALTNFAISRTRVHPVLIRAFGTVKEAAARANYELGYLKEPVARAIIKAAGELRRGEWQDQFPLDAVQGGAGTSTNMNVNEVIANRALEILGQPKARYDHVNPYDHVNLHQSTNDTYPTALKIAAIWMIRPLADCFAEMQTALQEKTVEFAGVIKTGRTQLQDAVPITVGQAMGAWAQAISRDRSRLYKAEQRLRHVPMGGTAVGTGMNAPQNYVDLVNDELRRLARIGIARAENMIDATQNLDVFTEVSGLLKATATNLTKIANDLRLMSSGPVSGLGELILPAVQSGSSIMPGKVNPVMPEMINQVAIRVVANDMAITQASSMGQLELNAFLPIVAHHLLDSLEIMTNGVQLFTELCIRGIQVDRARCEDGLACGIGAVTALTPHIGYSQAQEIYQIARRDHKTIRETVLALELFEPDDLDQILNLQAMTRPGIVGSVANSGIKRCEVGNQ
ncbi:MAG: aspartate ammonia-lyase [Solirubrobacterales bacterium]